MDSRVKNGHKVYDYPLTQEQGLNETKYTVTDYQSVDSSNSRNGFCDAISSAIKAVREAPLCVKIMGGIGILSLVGSGISAYAAVSAMSANGCRGLSLSTLAPKPETTPIISNTPNSTSPLPTNTTGNQSKSFSDVAENLPILILTSEPTGIVPAKSTNSTHVVCDIGGARVSQPTSDTIEHVFRTSHGHRNATDHSYELLSGISKGSDNCSVDSMLVLDDGLYDKVYDHRKTGYCDIYKATNKTSECIKYPKTASDARNELFKLGQSLGNELKNSENYKLDPMSENAKGYAEIIKIAVAYDDVGKDFKLGDSLKDGFNSAMRGEAVTTNAPSTSSNETSSASTNATPTAMPTTTTTSAIPTTTTTTKANDCKGKIDANLHATAANLACGFGAMGTVLIFGCLLGTTFEKSKISVRVGVPKNSGDLIVLSYNNVSHWYDVKEDTCSNNFNFDMTSLTKFLMSKGEKVEDVYEFMLDICNQVDNLSGNTSIGDRTMSSIRAFMKENHGNEFMRYMVSIGMEDPENNDGCCWFSSLFNWGSRPANNAQDVEYASIPLQEIRRPVGMSNSSIPSFIPPTPEELRRTLNTVTEEDDDVYESISLMEGMSDGTNSLVDGTYSGNSTQGM